MVGTPKLHIMQFIVPIFGSVRRPAILVYLAVSSVPRKKFLGATSKYSTTVSFHILYNSLQAHLVLLRYAVVAVFFFFFLQIIAIFQNFSSLLYLLWCSVTGLFYVAIVIVLGRHEPRPYKTANLTDKCYVCSVCTIDRQFPRLPLSSGLTIPRDTTILKLGQLITLQWPLSVQVKGSVAEGSDVC
jgi:hypothetical protein